MAPLKPSQAPRAREYLDTGSIAPSGKAQDAMPKSVLALGGGGGK